MVFINIQIVTCSPVTVKMLTGADLCCSELMLACGYVGMSTYIQRFGGGQTLGTLLCQEEERDHGSVLGVSVRQSGNVEASHLTNQISRSICHCIVLDNQVGVGSRMRPQHVVVRMNMSDAHFFPGFCSGKSYV